MAETFTDRLLSLEMAYEEAKARRTEARDALRAEESDADALAPIREFGIAMEKKLPSAGPADERVHRERELTDALVEEIKARGLVVRADVRRGIVLVDPDRAARYHAADAEAIAAGAAVESFRHDHAADLEAEQREAEADAYRKAIDSNNLDAARRIFNREDGGRPGVFTTDDLARPDVHRRSPVLGR